MGGELPSRLTYEDAAFYYFDRDAFPYNVGSVGIYEGTIAVEDYVRHVERRLDLVPRYRQRLLPTPFEAALPAWYDDPDFAIERHISHVNLPPPGDEGQLARLAAQFFATPLDRNKPLWEICLVNGLSGDRTAHLAKIHHCLVDGIAGVQLMGALLDVEPHPAETPTADPWTRPESLPGPLLRLVDAVFDRVIDGIGTGEAVAHGVIDPAWAIGHVRGVANALWAGRHHLFRIGRTPWATRLTSPRRLVWQTLPIDAVQEVRKALHGTVNDVVLTVMAGALGRYLDLHGVQADQNEVRALIPVNVRGRADAGNLGNRVSFMLAGLPAGGNDPVERFRSIQTEMANLKAIDQAGNLDRLSGVIGLTPPLLQRILGRRLTMPNFIYDFVCTNVPGPKVPLYCAGHRMLEHYPWVPIGWRAGLGVAVMSYCERLSITLTADQSVLADLDRLAGFVQDAFDELREAAGVVGEAAALSQEVPGMFVGAPGQSGSA